MPENYLKLNTKNIGLTGGIVGAIGVFLTTMLGILGLSKSSEILASTVWSNLGYNVSWVGAFIGAILGFVYAFIIMWFSAWIYNKLIS